MAHIESPTHTPPNWPRLLRALAQGIEEGWAEAEGTIIGSLVRADDLTFAAQLTLALRIERDPFEDVYLVT